MSKEIRTLLEELNKETGLHLEIADGEVDNDTSLRLQELLLSVKDHTRKDLFWQNLLLGQMSREEMLLFSHRFHIDLSARRVLFLVAFSADIDEVSESVLSTYVGVRDDLVRMDERHAIILHRQGSDDEDMRAVADTLSDMLSAEAMVTVKVAYDRPVEDMYELSGSLRHCEAALGIAELLPQDTYVVSYDELSFEKLLYSLPDDAAREYLSARAPGLDISDIDSEMMGTIGVLFKNELNLGDTAKELFIHRNTLVYRLDKFQKQTGLDLRRFDDAVACRVALILTGLHKDR